MSLVQTYEQLVKVCDYYSQVEAFAFDCETLGPAGTAEGRGIPVLNRVVWLVLACDGRTDVIPLGHPHGTLLRYDFPLTTAGEKRVAEGKMPLQSSYSKDKKKAKKIFSEPHTQLRWTDDVKEQLRRIFFCDAVKVGHNIKFDLESITKHLGATPSGPYADTMGASGITDSRNYRHLGLDDCALRDLGFKMQKGVGANIYEHDFPTVYRYTFIDGKATWLLWKEVRTRLAPVSDVWELECTGVLPQVVAMELEGVPVNMDRLNALADRLKPELEVAEAAVYRAAGRVFNLNSSQQKQEILYAPKREGGQGLAVKRRTKPTPNGGGGTPSTDEAALQYHADRGNAVCTALLEYAKLNKLWTAFVVSYKGGVVKKNTNGKVTSVIKESLLISNADGTPRIHAQFNQFGAETGRFSAKAPNLQQVPSHGEIAKLIRGIFIAGPGHKLVVADYGQVEPRVAADFAEEPSLIKTFLEERDIYTALADPFGLTRAAGKIIFLSVAYGTGPHKLATTVGIPLADAEKIINVEFPRRFKRLAENKRDVIRTARAMKDPYVITPLGRRRYLPELRSGDKYKRERAGRQAYNFLIQGTAADINKQAMTNWWQNAPEEWRLVLNVHDELVVRVPEDDSEQAAALLQECMTGVKMLNTVPLVADAKICDSWDEGKD